MDLAIGPLKQGDWAPKHEEWRLEGEWAHLPGKLFHIMQPQILKG